MPVIIKEPKDIPYLFMKAWNNYDAKGIAALFYEDADFVNVTGKWWDNKIDIWKAHDFGLRIIFQNSKLEIIKVKVKILQENIAVIHAHIRLIGQTANEVEKVDERQTMFLFVAQKEKESWLVVSAQNTDITGEQTNIRNKEGVLKSVSYKEKKIIPKEKHGKIDNKGSR